MLCFAPDLAVGAKGIRKPGGFVGTQQQTFDAIQYNAIRFAFRTFRRLNITHRARHNLDVTAYMRSIQNLRETGSRRNPDSYAHHLLSPFENRMARVHDLEKLRSTPIYHYMLARTKFYDAALQDAITNGVKQIAFVGVGMDTRAFRFRDVLDGGGLRVVESDLQPWISERARRCHRLSNPSNISRLELNLEKTGLKDWVAEAALDGDQKTAIFAEGVTPYISHGAYERLLRLASEFTPPGSKLYYDGKFENTRRDYWLSQRPDSFRVPRDEGAIRGLHAHHGLLVDEILASDEAQKRFTEYDAPLFKSDVLITATVQ